LRSGDCGGQVIWCSTPSRSNSPYSLEVCVGSLSCWKTNDSRTKHKPDGMAYRCRMLWQPCWLSVPWTLNKISVNSKTPPRFMEGTIHVEIICSPTLFHKDTAVGTKILKIGLIRPKDIFPQV
jgi:hypothetical protein